MSPVAAPRVAASCGSAEGLTVAQEQLLALHEERVDAAAVNLGYALRVDGPLDLRALTGALDALARRHETLRTRYGADAATDAPTEGIVQVGPRIADEQEAAALALAQRARPFDLASEPPVRLVVHPVAGDRHLVLLTLHHVAADGWALRVISSELSALYRARLRNERADLPQLGLTCAGYAARQRRWLAGEAAERELDWWHEQLAGVRGHTLTPGRVRSGLAVEMGRRTAVLPDDVTAALRTLARSARVSLFVVLQTALSVLLTHWTGRAEAITGTLAANRGSADNAGLLGAHYNVLLLRTDLRGDPTLAECMLRIATTVVAALDHQALPYPAVADALRLSAGWDADLMPAAMLLVDAYPLGRLALDGCAVTGLHVGDAELGRVDAVSSAELSLCVREARGRLTLSALHAPTLDDREVSTLMAAYVDVLALMCEAPDLSLGELAGRLAPPRPRERAAGAAGLHDVAETAAVDALSPVGRWDPPR